MDSISFTSWYEQVHGYEPFPWQQNLAEAFAQDKLPSSLSVPTGTGKTAIVAVWLWAAIIGKPVPKRLIYVVDRRLIVDSVTDYALKIGCNVVKMRGGVTIDESWLMEPQEPRVIVSTVDQVGSRLLWRGYGVSSRVAPIHAALVGNDALIVLDEAHISTPFAETLKAVNSLRKQSPFPWHFITMTATPLSSDESITLTEEDKQHPVLKKRLNNSKLAKLRKVSKESFVRVMTEEAERLMEDCKGVVGVICNVTSNARAVFDRLKGEKVLLTGRVRPIDKDRILESVLPNMISGSREHRAPLFVVATQTIEVGADLDFDALITQSAPIDALRQRFGRLDRLGELGVSNAAIIHKQLDKGDECPIYGKMLLQKTWSWLNKAQTGKGVNKVVDFGLSAMGEQLAESPPPLRPAEKICPLTAQDLRKLRQTIPEVSVDITPWLHGSEAGNVSVQVVWRSDLGDDTAQWASIVSASPPVVAEMMPCPLYEVQRWLAKRSALVRDQIRYGKALRPGDVLVIPTDYGGYGEWGWKPESDEPVADVGNEAGAKFRLVGADERSDIKALLEAANANFLSPVVTVYPGGLVVSEAKKRTKERSVLLEDHLRDAAEVSKMIVDMEVVHEAVRLHDIGKQDPRFQVALGARGAALAKSSFDSPVAAKMAREWSGLPDGWRHEVASVSMLPEDSPELLRYLVGTHHGYSRAILPLCKDISLWEKAGGKHWGNMAERLNEEYGAWGLAYMEALVRLSDWIQSRREQSNAI